MAKGLAQAGPISDMSNIEIRRAPIALKGRITELCRQTYDKHRDAQPYAWAANYFDLAIQPHLDAAFTDKHGKQQSESPTLFVAMKDGEFAGYLRMADWSSGIGGDLHIGSIEDICVIPEFQGQGVARALIEYAKELAEKNDWDNLVAQVAEWNVASEGLFEASGFTDQSRTYRIGPNRQARDVPAPSEKRLVSLHDWLWIALAVFALAATAFLLTK